MRNGARFVIALTLGLRQGEALGLQWRDVDLDGQIITIRRSVQLRTWQHGCIAKEPCGRRYAGHCPERHSGGVTAAEVKSRAGRRSVGVPIPLVDFLRQHKERQDCETVHAANLWIEQGWVFTNHVGGPVHPKVDHSEWKALLRCAGVRDARLHDARHTAATMLLLLGVPSRAVMEVMGWSQASMTTRYQHVTPELTRCIANKVGDLL
jgi:integrase